MVGRSPRAWLVAICLALQPLLFYHAAGAQASPDPAKLLSAVDRSRMPWSSAEMEIAIRTTEPGKPAATERFVVRVGSGERSLVRFVDGEGAGQYLLMRPEGMWMYFPKTRRAIRITPIQRLTGNTSNGDIANLPFTGNYTAKAAGEETVDGVPAWILDLTAVSATATYPRIRLWVSQSTGLPLRAHYFLASGKLMKVVEDFRFNSKGGQPLLAAMSFLDPNRKGSVSEMRFEQISEKRFPEQWFQSSYLPLLKE